jgi:hypothetical protein
MPGVPTPDGGPENPKGDAVEGVARRKWEDLAKDASKLISVMIAANKFGGGQGAVTGAGIGSSLGEYGGAQLGKLLGGVAGSVVPVVGTVVGSFLGASIGSLFDKKDEKDEIVPVLQRIDRNTREAAQTLELERKLREIARGSINVPASFWLPGFLPGGGSGSMARVTVGTIQVSPTIVTNGDPEQVAEAVRETVGPMLREEFQRLGFGR